MLIKGGMGSISEVLALNTKTFDDQIDIFVNQEIKQIELNSNKTKTTGVLLSDGKFIESEYVLSNATPHVTFRKLMENFKLEEHENEDISKFFKRIGNINYESGTMKINLAVDKLPNFIADPNIKDNTPMPHHQTTIHINSENMKIIDDAYNELKIFKRPSSKPMIEMVIPSVLDPTLAPRDSHVILLFCQYFPMNKALNSNYKEDYANIVFDSIEKYAPGFKKSIIGKDILTPFDLENEFGLTGGNIFHGAMPLNQLFISRPVNEYCTYTTPIENLYLAGSGSHPGGNHLLLCLILLLMIFL
jgi:phytoene dehydrogenase-like protein